MSFTGTQTTTFTVVDIRKVVDNFAADFSMKAQATGLRTRENVAEIVYDLKILAEGGYLENVKLILKDASGTEIRGTKYTVSNSAAGWVSERPGHNLWPRTPGGVLKVIAGLTCEWWAKTEEEKAAFISVYGLHWSWSLTTEDTSFATLTAS